MNFVCLIFWFFPILVTSLNEGGECKIENVNGKCLNIHKCNYAIRLVRANRIPQICGFQGRDPIVCCPKPSSVHALNVGEKSANKCKEYHPPPIGVGGFAYARGAPALSQEFPHMALLGYRGINNNQWACGGSLISENFVLTAAHCLYSQKYGLVSKVRLGELDTNSTTDDARPMDYGIAEIFQHPNFRPPSHYNDIGLIKLNRHAIFNGYVWPACLYTNYMYNLRFNGLTGTGWGKTEFLTASGSSHLVKANLDYIAHETCAKRYSDHVSAQRLENGIIDEIQICAGGQDGRDACQGDSGGPLQFHSYIQRQYYVVGVTSFGKACGYENSIGVYSRVAPFTAWIENIVWP